MLDYPITLRKVTNDTYLVTSRDFPELTTFGDDKAEALLHAQDALEEAIAARIAHQQDIPSPSTGRNRVAVPFQTEIKTLLYQTMRNKGVRKAGLARKLGWHSPQVDRLFDLRHNSKIGQLEAAFEALDARLDVEVLV
jgi:antitoxin HicB